MNSNTTRQGVKAMMMLALLGSVAAMAQDDWQLAYQVGDAVELKINDRIWQQCNVSQNPAGGLMRVNCTAYVEPAPGSYRRAGGVYIVYGKSDLRRKGDVSATVAKPQQAPVARNAVTRANTTAASAPVAAPGRNDGGNLRVGEYACYGSGGRILAGFGFKALAGGRYTDLEGGNAGAYRVNGDSVTFKGGHLDGTVGRALKNGNFRIGLQATCEPF